MGLLQLFGLLYFLDLIWTTIPGSTRHGSRFKFKFAGLHNFRTGKLVRKVVRRCSSRHDVGVTALGDLPVNEIIRSKTIAADKAPIWKRYLGHIRVRLRKLTVNTAKKSDGFSFVWYLWNTRGGVSDWALVHGRSESHKSLVVFQGINMTAPRCVQDIDFLSRLLTSHSPFGSEFVHRPPRC